MSDFPEGITAPEGAQILVDVCKEAWAVIQDESSDVTTNDEAVGRYEIAVDELNDLGVHVNNEVDHPVFELGVKETACHASFDPTVASRPRPRGVGYSPTVSSAAPPVARVATCALLL
jgi:hypothetical protein